MSYVRATARLQFHKEFTLDDAIPLVAYFKQLGVSHIYASPLLRARAGSMHGYDIVDPTSINPELGGEDALYRLVTELRKHQMGLIVDVVSNHMAVGGNDNPWWLDLLRWGLKSPYASFFDIQWNSPDPLLKGQLLLPFLRAGYGEVLAAGEITIHFDTETGTFYARHNEHHFPIYPPSYGHILRNSGNNSLLALVRPFEMLEMDPDGWNSAAALHEQLKLLSRDPQVAESLAHALQCYAITANDEQIPDAGDENPSAKDEQTATRSEHAGDLHPEWQQDANLQRLHEFLELQHFRLASWTTAADDINWRRFFDVNQLGGLQVERPEVFEATHAKIFELVGKGLIDGLRIDHVDGLANPRGYCRKLHRRLDQLCKLRPQGAQCDYIPIYVEKILAGDEPLSTSWMVDGTTGYDFMNQVSLVQHDPVGEMPLKILWSHVSGRNGSFEEEVIEARQTVLTSILSGDVEMISQGLLLVARTDIATRDLTLGAIRRALIELVAHFPVYRTYVCVTGRSEHDQAIFNKALEGARTTLAEIDWPILDYLDRWLGGQPLHELPPGSTRKLRKKLIARFQQLTSPAAAKAVEDTACYRSAVLLSRNDVGFDPQRFSASVGQFHQYITARAVHFPHSLLATATHDHKRGEDMRARLAVVSECADWFAGQVESWKKLAASLHSQLEDGSAPSGGDELMLYQTLLGSWPLELDVEDSLEIENYLKRLLGWQEKAMREAKLRSSWTAPNTAYEEVSRNFLTRLLTQEEWKNLRKGIMDAAMSIAPAGALNSLAQCLLRMSVPGIPDLYQGTEFWDFSLVDPDNRRPVDFGARITALENQPELNNRPDLGPLMVNWHDGRLKQFLIAQTLNARESCAELFADGSYIPLVIEGALANHIIAFARQYQDTWLIVVVPHLAYGLMKGNKLPQVPAAAWGDLQLILPEGLVNAPKKLNFKSIFSHTGFSAGTGRIAVSDVLADFPVNLLLSTSSL